MTWRGMLPAEGGGVGIGPQVGPYFVPGPAGLLAAILTHGAIMQGVQSAQRKQEQADADKVLESYASTLKPWPAIELWEAAAGGRERLWDGHAPVPGPVVELEPTFSLAQDEGALVLDVAVRLTTSAGAPAALTTVKVVSTPLGAGDARSHWSADEAKRLKQAAAAMLAHAAAVVSRHVQVAAAPATATKQRENTSDLPPNQTQPAARTHRYLQGQVERSERAELVASECGRVVLRTLRGGLMSVPIKRPADSECEIQTLF